MNAQVHDILHIDPESVNVERLTAPAWARDALMSWPWVVVRRDKAPKDQIPVGVRGATRGDRWAGFVTCKQVREVIRPEDLLMQSRSSRLGLRTPAVQALRQMDERWRDLSFLWGPAGSVGFELASGQLSTNESSDLDLVVRAPARISRERARFLWNHTKGLAVRVDVRIESLHCGFLLEEYACLSSGPILLRYRDGPKLGADPWSDE